MPGYAVTAYAAPRGCVKSKKITFMIFSREYCPSTKREHWQGYIETQKKLGYRQIQRLLGVKAHVETARKDKLHNVVYCLKDGVLSHLLGNSADPQVDRVITSQLKKSTYSKTRAPQPFQDAKNVSKEVNTPKAPIQSQALSQGKEEALLQEEKPSNGLLALATQLHQEANRCRNP